MGQTGKERDEFGRTYDYERWKCCRVTANGAADMMSMWFDCMSAFIVLLSVLSMNESTQQKSDFLHLGTLFKPAYGQTDGVDSRTEFPQPR